MARTKNLVCKEVTSPDDYEEDEDKDLKIDEEPKTRYCIIEFTDKQKMRGWHPISALKQYNHDVFLSGMEDGYPLIGSWITRRFPLTMPLLCDLMLSCGIQNTWCINSQSPLKHDPEKPETIKDVYPDLYSEFMESWEGIVYFRFDDCITLTNLFTTRKIRDLGPSDLLRALNILTSDPVMFAFR